MTMKALGQAMIAALVGYEVEFADNLVTTGYPNTGPALDVWVEGARIDKPCAVIRGVSLNNRPVTILLVEPEAGS